MIVHSEFEAIMVESRHERMGQGRCVARPVCVRCRAGVERCSLRVCLWRAVFRGAVGCDGQRDSRVPATAEGSGNPRVPLVGGRADREAFEGTSHRKTAAPIILSRTPFAVFPDPDFLVFYELGNGVMLTSPGFYLVRCRFARGFRVIDSVSTQQFCGQRDACSNGCPKVRRMFL